MLKEKLMDYTESIVKRATYTINGKVKEGTIGKAIRTGDSITCYLYIDDNEQGKITNAKLYDVNGDLLESKDYNTPKDTLGTVTLGIRITLKRDSEQKINV